MKKMTWSEWQEYEAQKREDYKKMGVVDFEEKRSEKMWDDPLVKDEDIPHVKFTWDKERKEFVFTGHINQVEH